MWLAFVRDGVRGATVISLVFVAPAFLIVVVVAWIYFARLAEPAVVLVAAVAGIALRGV